MQLFTVLILILGYIPPVYPNVDIKKYYHKDQVGPLSAEKFDYVLTRGNACSIIPHKIQLKQYYEGKFINDQNYYNILHFLSLAYIYSEYLEELHGYATTNSSKWKTKFINWDRLLNIKGGVYGFEVYGIRGVYSYAQYARIYLPYTIEDSLILSCYLWQISLHDALKAQKENSLARSIPQSVIRLLQQNDENLFKHP